MKIAIICPSEIALRRFMPALIKFKNVKYIGVGISSVEERFEKVIPSKEEVENMLEREYEKAQKFVTRYGGKIFNSYEEVVKSNEVDAVYIPLPPALHYKWAKKALEYGKHVLIEKPSTTRASDTRALVFKAKECGLALHENYMFTYHDQLNAIDDIIKNGEIGDVRLYRISFGFPHRDKNDFRYNKMLGGGALIDAGGYTIKYATHLLGNDSKIIYAKKNYTNEYEVDIYGSGALANGNGTTCQISYGMDNSYKCELEVWGSKGQLLTERVLTAPDGFVPKVIIKKNGKQEIRDLPADDTFYKSIEHFIKCIKNVHDREIEYRDIISQADLVEEFNRLADM